MYVRQAIELCVLLLLRLVLSLHYGRFDGYAQIMRKRHDYTIGTLDVLQACDTCADMGMTYSVIVQCTDCVVFPRKMQRLNCEILL